MQRIAREMNLSESTFVTPASHPRATARVRIFTPGSATGPLAAYMLRHGLAPREDGRCIVSEQGVKMGRRSLLYARVRLDGDDVQIEVGGSVVPVAEATLTLPD